MTRLLAPLLILLLLVSCASKAPVTRKGGTPGGKPYTVRGKTYYPLKSDRGFMEEGLASWYGPGFHGKATSSGEKYNQYAMTAAHKILPLGSRVRVTRLDNGRSTIVRVNDRGPFVDDRVIDLSRAAATRLEMLGSGTARVRVQSLGELPEITREGDIEGKFYVQAGAFGDKNNARKFAAELEKRGFRGRIIRGVNNLWNAQVGPWNAASAARRALDAVKAIYPNAFVVGDK